MLPFISAFIYLRTATFLRGFDAATALNGFIFVLFLVAGEADTAFIIGMLAVTALAEIIRHFNRNDAKKGVRLSFVPFAFSFFTYTLHWWTNTEGSLAAAVKEVPAGYDQLMVPVIENVPLLVIVLVFTIPIAIFAMRLAACVMKKTLQN